jgi:NAD(P)H-dependent FMN reductase
MQQKYQRRSREEWQQIIDQFQASGQSGSAFCKAQAIPYASFCQWRQTLAAVPAVASTSTDGGFVDLQSLIARDGGWRIVLRLGTDIELVLSQP